MNMYLSKKTSIFLFSLLISCIQAEIIEISHFHEILEYVSHNAVVLVDIDNTLLEPHDDYYPLGSDQWFTHLLQTESDFEKVLHLYCNAILATPMQATEPTITETVALLAQQALVLGFTMRSMVLAPCTIERLAHNAIIFPKQFPDKGFMIDTQHPVMVYHDIIFCQGQKNGLTLFTVLDNYGIKPAIIIMIDDKRRYLESVELECAQRNIQFIGLRYGYLDEKVAQFLREKKVTLSGPDSNRHSVATSGF